MKKIISALLILALTICILAVPAQADENVLVNLLPEQSMQKDELKVTGCDLEYGIDGAVTATMTSGSATIEVIMVNNGTVLLGDTINVGEPAFAVADYASADGVTLEVHANYTRKDKEASGTVADLFLSSMENAQYAEFAKAKGDGYVVWDWGTYVASAPAKVFDDKLHRFTKVTYTLTGSVGAKLTIYRFYIGSSAEVEGIGALRPEPTPEESSVAPVSSEAESAASSEAESAASSEAESQVSAESSDAASSEAVAESSDASSSSAAANSVAGSESVADDDGCLPTWAWVLIGVGVAAIIAGAVILILKKKRQ